ncbi:MAG: TrmJ/YjtD family RNA methyltransferase [Bryobacterales bacterium]|nr:TrmJ/YjtD family RNA methyltransferase [Bryobacterales bacterium]
MPLHVVLISPRNPLNIGAAARAMSNFGFADLRLVNPYRSAVEEARSGLNAGDILRQAREYASLAEAVGDAALVVGATGTAARALKTPVYRLEQGAVPLREAMASSSAALVFGSEKYGLSREEISHCHHLVHIPTREAHDSMNLGQAVAVCLYELVRSEAAVATPMKRPRRASAATLDRLHTLLFRLLKSSGYVKPRIAESTGEKLRQLLLRLHPGATDANLLLGMARQIELALARDDVRRKARRDWPTSGEEPVGRLPDAPRD